MPVVINEFEVLPDTTPRPAPATTAQPTPPPLDAAALQRLLLELHEQALRLHAH
ncbi:MAG: hypothetical protein Q8K45_10835 [Rubrivivax sp.]|nr:hypothetical protein [Rubrivivax sp.]